MKKSEKKSVEKISQQSFIKYFLSLIFLSFFAGCAADSSDVDTGFFIDAPVQGLMFESGSIAGRTDNEGRYYYEGSQSLTFSIDGLVIGQAQPAETLFPFDLFTSTLFVSDEKVNNMSRFLQSLDNDGNPENGIVIDEPMRNKVTAHFGSATSLNFSASSFASISTALFNNISVSVRSPIAAKTHLLSSLADYNRLEVSLITLGDGFTAGMQSTKISFDNFSASSVNLHQFTQTNGYAQLMRNEIRNVLGSNLTWSNPLLEIKQDRNKTLISPDILHYNLSVPGATTDAFLNATTQSFSSYSAESKHSLLNELLVPIFKNLSTPCTSGTTQLDAAKCLASQATNRQKLKIFTLWIGMNDILGSISANGGSELTGSSINTYLTSANRDLTSVLSNISTIVSELSSIKDSYLFIATIPDVTRSAALFYEEDIEFLARYDTPDITGLKNYTSAFTLNSSVVALGFSAFTSIAPFLNVSSDNITLDGAINALPDNLTLSRYEAELIKTRVNNINASIIGYADPELYPNVFVVDLYQLLENVAAGQYEVDAEATLLDRGYGGGFYSMDGIYPSNYGYALIAKEFLKRIGSPYAVSDQDNPAFASYTAAYRAFVNEKGNNVDNGIGIKVDAENLNLNEIWSKDPYRDNDGDGFPDGPGNILFLNGTSISSYDSSLDLMRDCNDGNINTLPPVISGISCD